VGKGGEREEGEASKQAREQKKEGTAQTPNPNPGGGKAREPKVPNKRSAFAHHLSQTVRPEASN
jgi:hypothetical protein